MFYPNYTREHLLEVLDNSFENMGRVGSHTSQGSEWAVVSSTPSKLYKGLVAEGGIRSPFIVRGPGIEPATRSAEIGHVMDIAPTIYELAGVDTNGLAFQGKTAVEGVPITAAWQGGSLPGRTLITELFGMRMVRRGDWKAHFIIAPFGSGDWQLFNLADDPAELVDLGEERPELLAELVAAYDAWAIDQNVILPEGSADGRELSISMFYDQPCDWWCSARFGLVDLLSKLQ